MFHSDCNGDQIKEGDTIHLTIQGLGDSFVKVINHECGVSGAKVYCVGKYLVQTSWGSSKPIAVYASEEEMLFSLEQAYKIKPVIKYL